MKILCLTSNKCKLMSVTVRKILQEENLLMGKQYSLAINFWKKTSHFWIN